MGLNQEGYVGLLEGVGQIGQFFRGNLSHAGCAQGKIEVATVVASTVDTAAVCPDFNSGYVSLYYGLNLF